MLFYVVIILVGLCLGSFLNVVIYRLPLMIIHEPTQFNLCFPRSHCPYCQQTIAWRYNIPIVSYCYLKGRCHTCQQPIAKTYLIVEILTTLCAALLAWRFGFSITFVAVMIFIGFLIPLTIIDLQYQLLPDHLTLPLLWIGLLINTQAVFTPLSSAVWGVMLGYSCLWLIYWMFKLITGKEGLGYGDFKLLAALGAWLGWMSLLIVLVLASLVGALVGIILLIKGHPRDKPIPFGPFLCAAGFIVLLLD